MSQLLGTVGEWQVFLDPKTKREYYSNTSTKVVTWNCPEEVMVEYQLLIAQEKNKKEAKKKEDRKKGETEKKETKTVETKKEEGAKDNVEKNIKKKDIEKEASSKEINGKEMHKKKETKKLCSNEKEEANKETFESEEEKIQDTGTVEKCVVVKGENEQDEVELYQTYRLIITPSVTLNLISI